MAGGIYYDPQYYYKTFGDVIPEAMKTYMGLQGIEKQEAETKVSQFKAQQAERQIKTENQIGEASKRFEESMKNAPPAPEAPKAGPMGLMPGAEKYVDLNSLPSVVSKEFQGPLGQGAIAEANKKVMADYQKEAEAHTAYKMEKQGELYNGVMKAYMDNGLMGEAMQIRRHYYDHIKDLAAISPTAALRVAKSGIDSDILKDVTEKDLTKGDIEIKMNKSGYLLYNKRTGEEKFVKTSKDDNIKTVDGNLVRVNDDGSTTVLFKKQGKEIQVVGHDMMEKDENGNWKLVHRAPYQKDLEGGGKTKWNASKVESYYNNLLKDLTMKDEETGLVIPRPGYEDYVKKIASYRSQDVLAVERGFEPTNVKKVADALWEKEQGGSPKKDTEGVNYRDGQWRQVPDGADKGKWARWNGSKFEIRDEPGPGEKTTGKVPANSSSAKPTEPVVKLTPAQQAAKDYQARSGMVAGSIAGNRAPSSLDRYATSPKELPMFAGEHNILSDTGSGIAQWAGSPISRVVSDYEYQKSKSKR